MYTNAEIAEPRKLPRVGKWVDAPAGDKHCGDQLDGDTMWCIQLFKPIDGVSHSEVNDAQGC